MDGKVDRCLYVYVCVCVCVCVFVCVFVCVYFLCVSVWLSGDEPVNGIRYAQELGFYPNWLRYDTRPLLTHTHTHVCTCTHTHASTCTHAHTPHTHFL